MRNIRIVPLAQINKTSISYIAQLVWKEEFETEKKRLVIDSLLIISII